MNKIKIEKGVPLPESKGRGPNKGPFHLMEVGDSFWTPSSAGVYYSRGKALGFKLTSRKEEKDGHFGRRVWRIA